MEKVIKKSVETNQGQSFVKLIDKSNDKYAENPKTVTSELGVLMALPRRSEVPPNMPRAGR